MSVVSDGTTGTITISSTDMVAVGSYPFTFEGTSGGITKTVDLILNIFENNVSQPVLTMPADGANDQSTQIDLMWNGSANVQNYFVEIAEDINFTSIFDSATVQMESYTVSSLMTSTTFYWRVTASNLCGSSVPSSVYSFTTALISCDTYTASDTPIDILETGNQIDTYTSMINVSTNEVITDVNVTINIQHDWNNDLDISLISPAGTVVELATDNGADDEDNYTNTVFDQEASTNITAGTSPFTGTFVPEGDLSTLYGELSGGDWTLSVDDDFGFADGGQIIEFTLEICVENTLSITESTIDGFAIFPNPNQGTFTVAMNSNSGNAISIDVYDIRGRQIFKNTYTNGSDFNQVINLPNAQSGLYVVRIKDGDNELIKKIIIE